MQDKDPTLGDLALLYSWIRFLLRFAVAVPSSSISTFPLNQTFRIQTDLL